MTVVDNRPRNVRPANKAPTHTVNTCRQTVRQTDRPLTKTRRLTLEDGATEKNGPLSPPRFCVRSPQRALQSTADPSSTPAMYDRTARIRGGQSVLFYVLSPAYIVYALLLCGSANASETLVGFFSYIPVYSFVANNTTQWNVALTHR